MKLCNSKLSSLTFDKEVSRRGHISVLELDGVFVLILLIRLIDDEAMDTAIYRHLVLVARTDGLVALEPFGTQTCLRNVASKCALEAALFQGQVLKWLQEVDWFHWKKKTRGVTFNSVIWPSTLAFITAMLSFMSTLVYDLQLWYMTFNFSIHNRYAFFQYRYVLERRRGFILPVSQLFVKLLV